MHLAGQRVNRNRAIGLQKRKQTAIYPIKVNFIYFRAHFERDYRTIFAASQVRIFHLLNPK